MPEFSIKEAALTGFRFARENPGAILVWALVSIIGTAIYYLIFVSMAGEAIVQMQALQEQAQTDPQAVDPGQMFSAMGQMMTGTFVGFIPLFVASVMITAAATRAILRPEARGLGFVRFGADELRLIAVLIVVGILLGLIYFVGTIVSGIIAFAVIGAGGGGPPAPGELPAGMMAALLPPMLLAGLIMLYVYSRFSLAPPLTLDRRAINIFSSVAMTKGRSGRVFRTYLLALLLYLVVAILGACIFAGIGAAMTGDMAELQAFFTEPDMSSVEAFMSPLRIVYLVFMSVIGALGAAIMLTPPAAIYRAITAEGVDEVF